MNDGALSAAKELHRNTRHLLAITALSGLLLIVVSLLLRNIKSAEFYGEILKELGIVLFSVFSVSLIYEVQLAEKHLEKFRTILRMDFEQARSVAATCSTLGINEIFQTREDLGRRYPLADSLARTDADSKIRMIAVSLFHTMNNAEAFRQALINGARIDLCMLPPNAPRATLSKLKDLEIDDLKAALRTFRKQFEDWLERRKPQGRLELRFHDAFLFQSLSTFLLRGRSFCVWELSFGRDTRDKRIFLLDCEKKLAQNLAARFEALWKEGEPAFLYEGGEIKVNELKIMIPID